MTVATGIDASELPDLDARLLLLDPDLEELFAEVDAILRDARRPRPSRWHPVGPRRWSPGVRREPHRAPGRRPDPARARERGPPGSTGIVGHPAAAKKTR